MHLLDPDLCVLLGIDWFVGYTTRWLLFELEAVLLNFPTQKSLCCANEQCFVEAFTTFQISLSHMVNAGEAEEQ